MSSALRLRHGALELALEPALGACCSAFRHHGAVTGTVDIFRPLPPGSSDSFQSGCFMLAPYSNRLFGGRLLLRDGEVPDMPLNRAGVALPVHGLGWMKAWSVRVATDSGATLGYHHMPDAHWLFEHSCTVAVQLTETAGGPSARFDLELLNLSPAPMPAGLGFHPYFALDADTSVCFRAQGIWEQDEQGAPRVLKTTAGAARFDFSHGQPAAAVELNHCFAQWDGIAELRWPQRGLAMQLTASPNLGHLMVYRPPLQGWLCIEPVSHATGAFSLESLNKPEHGVRWIAPGEAMQASMEITVNECAV